MFQLSVGEIVDGMTKYVQSDGGTNYIALIEGTNIVTQILIALLNVFAGMIIIGLPIVVAIELCYINLPLFQDRCNNLYHRLEGKPNQVFVLVIRDAMVAVERANTIEIGKNANWIYLRIKCVQIFLSMFIVTMVLGPGPILIGYAFTFAKNIVNVLKGVL